MTPAPAYAGPRAGNWFTRTQSWLDARGRAAWIAATILGFFVFWPLGLALLAYTIWSKRMFTGKSCRSRGRHLTPTRFRGTGNTAFDSYKSDMLRRLEDEQEAFESFLNRLREAKDKAEFDQFMEDRAKRGDENRAEV